ncbi:MAG TPA: HAD family hydrolase [Candidatus Saccharimonadales bacterium]|nr:HAD family hydrolase [Candidatus Saccharimonadales bacterium]
MYKALIADIDNTLVPIRGDGSDIDSATISAVSRALRNNIQISVATGRGWSSTKPVVQKLGIIDLCIIEGGASIVSPITEEIVWEKTLDAQTSSKTVEIFRRFATSSELIKSSSKPDRIPLKEAGKYGFKNRVIYLLGTDKATALKVKSALDRLPTASANITTPSWAGDTLFDVHVTNEHGTKEYALDEWYRLTGLKKNDTVGMGDSANDLPLFHAVRLKVAVGNATDDLKSEADYIAPTRQNGALKDVLNKFFLGST